MSELDEKLRQFQQAQQALYSYLGISRRDENQKHTKTAGLRYTHGSGNIDIPTAYPEVLDYRAKEWKATSSEQNSDDEIHVRIDETQDWEPENTVRFNILSIWTSEDGYVGVMASHLPKADELHYAHPDEVPNVEAGNNFFGDSCLLLLTPDLGTSELDDYQEYTKY
jgi:hypothetical protein